MDTILLALLVQMMDFLLSQITAETHQSNVMAEVQRHRAQLAVVRQLLPPYDQRILQNVLPIAPAVQPAPAPGPSPLVIAPTPGASGTSAPVQQPTPNG